MNDRVNVIIPTIDGREDIIMSCLASILCQSHSNWDLTICTTNPNIVVGDRTSSDLLSRFLGSIRYAGHAVKVVLDTKKTGPGTAVQQLLDATDAPWVFRVDDDVILTTDVLKKLVEIRDMEQHVAAIACPANGFGASLVDYKEYWEQSQTKNHRHLILNGNYESMNDNFSHHSCFGDFEVAETDFLSGYALLLNRYKLETVRGYADPDGPRWHTEDWYATLKLRAKGYRLWVRGDAIAFHHHRREDASHEFARSRADLDKEIFRKYRAGLQLNPLRKIGRITEELKIIKVGGEV